MRCEIKQGNWNSYLNDFTIRNAGRPTRLGVFEPAGKQANDYWIECGLPLIGVDIDGHGELPTLQIMAGSLSHAVANVTDLHTKHGEDEGLDICDADGRCTILRFENA